MPAISSVWMESSRWHQQPLEWATYANLLAPQVNVRGRMALILLVAVIWAFSWLLWRAYSVILTPNDVLVDKLGLDIPPTPLVSLEEISSREVQIAWKHSESSTSVQEHHIELNGRIIGTTKKNETAAVILNLLPGNLYDIRVFTISPGRFQTPSSPLRIRTPQSTQDDSQDESGDTLPTVRGISARNSQIFSSLSAPAMTREHSGGQPISRRGTTARRPSPANHIGDSQTSQAEFGPKGSEDEVDENLAELSQRFQKVQQDIEAVEGQIQEEDKEFDSTYKLEEARRDELKHRLKEREEQSSDLRRQVHKAETASRAALNDKTKKERELQSKENQRRKRREEIAKWDDQILSMAEEMAGIETQKAAIERRSQSDIREVRGKIEEEQKEVAALEEENKEKALQIKSLEEERKQLDFEDETDETREADRLERERDLRWRERFAHLNAMYSRIWSDLQQAQHHYGIAKDRLALYENVRRTTSVAFAPVVPLDLDALRRGAKAPRRPRHPGSLGSSVSSPRGTYATEVYQPSHHFTSPTSASPTTFGPSFFNPQNGMTLMMPSDLPPATFDELEPITSMPMSPRADALLPADLLGDESADDVTEDGMGMPTKPTVPDSGMSPFPDLGSPSLPEDIKPAESPSAGSSSSKSFSSPREAFSPTADSDLKSIHSGRQENDKENVEDSTQIRKRMSNLFSFNRQRGKTLAEQGPALGSLKLGQSQSLPRDADDFIMGLQPRRRLSYGGNWAARGNSSTEKDSEPSRISFSRRAFPSLIPGFVKSSNGPSYDPFAIRSNSFDPGLRGESSSPRPSSTYSFDKLPRPSMESQFHAWNVEKSALRNSPLAPDWGSLNSFSRSHSRRPSIGYGSTTNLAMAAHADEEVVEPRREPSRPLQAPIGTRPTSSQRPVTPKLNPAAPSFTMLFGKRGDKTKEKGRPKDRSTDSDNMSPPESRKSKDTQSIAPTISTAESRDSLDRIISTTSSSALTADSTPVKPTFISKITRKASSNKFGSWKEKGSIFSRKDASTPNAELEEDNGSTEHLGKSLESTSTTPSADDKKSSRSSLTSWNFMRKSKKGGREDLAASEISESSERASEIGEETGEDE